MADLLRLEHVSKTFSPGTVHEKKAVEDLSLALAKGDFVTVIGSNGAGKSTLFGAIAGSFFPDGGKILLDGEDIYDERVDVTLLRRRVGMVFQQPNPFPMSIYDNVAYGPRLQGVRDKGQLEGIVEHALRGAAIFDEVKDRLKKPALGLSGGQQQRLCMARALAVEPEVLLLDEPTSALDPVSTRSIEELMKSLRERMTMVIVTHNMQQAARVADDMAFFLGGEVVESGSADSLFRGPVDRRTKMYLTGRFG